MNSAIGRLGGDADSYVRLAELLQPAVFWPNQFYRIGMATLPYALNPYEIKKYSSKLGPDNYPAIAWGVLAVGFCLAGLAFSGVRRHPGLLLLLATLAVSGFCWALPLRYSAAFHDSDSVFYIGIPLAAIILALQFLRRWRQGRLAPYFAVAALGVFALSVSAMAGVGESPAYLAAEAEQMTEYAAIRELAEGNATIYVTQEGNFSDGSAGWTWKYYLSGKSMVLNKKYEPRKPYQPEDGDYMLMFTREDNPALLTPEHRYIFLYDWTLYDEWLRTIDRGRPIIAGDWQVYLRDGYLTYVSPECANRDEPFLLHFGPQDATNLRSAQQEYGYANQDFAFQSLGITLTDGTCIVERPLPEYDISAIRTGQYNAAGRLWEGAYRLPP